MMQFTDRENLIYYLGMTEIEYMGITLQRNMVIDLIFLTIYKKGS
ncbi:hypothetical protein [Fonticella tunisiensis]|nr:hypothetical protein [Fonticella tunisiensis]